MTTGFESLRSACVPLSKGISLDRLVEFRSTVARLNAAEMEPLVAYASWPLVHALRSNDALAPEILTALIALVEKCRSQAIDMRIWRSLFRQGVEDGLVKRCDDETSATISVQLVTMLLMRPPANNEIERELRVRSGAFSLRAQLGYAVFQLVQVLSQSSRELLAGACDALHCIPDFIVVNSSCVCEDKGWSRIGLLARYAPAVLSTLARTSSADYKLGSFVQAKALHAFGKWIVSLLNDKSHRSHVPSNLKDLAASLNQLTSCEKEGAVHGESGEDIIELECGKEWLEQTSDRVSGLVLGILNALFDGGRPSSNHKLRKSVVDFSILLCSSCARTLSTVIPKLMDVLAAYCQDPIDDIRESSRNAFRSMRYDISIPLVQEKLATLTQAIHSDSASTQLAILNSATTLVELLDHDSARTLWTLSSGRLNEWLLAASTIDEGDARVLEHHSTTFYEVRFVHLRGRPEREAFVRLLSALGKSAPSLQIILDSFSAESPEKLFVSYQLMIGLISSDQEKAHDYLLAALDFFGSLQFNSKECVAESICVRAIGELCSASREKISVVVLQLLLYPLLERLGHRNEIVSHNALVSLNLLSQSWCGVPNLSRLVVENWDYVVDAIAFRLRSDSRTRRMLPTLIQAATTFGGVAVSKIVRLLDDVIDDVLDAIDYFRHERAVETLECFVILRSYANLIAQESQSSIFRLKLPEESKGSAPNDHFTAADLAKRLCKFHEQLNHDSFCDFDEDVTDPPDDVVDDKQSITQSTAQDEPCDDHKRFTQIVEKLLHFVGIEPGPETLGQQIMILDTLESSLIVLSTNENQFLPAVAKVWTPLVEMLKSLRSTSRDIDFVVSLVPLFCRCVELLCIIASQSADFMRRRFAVELWPVLCSTIEACQYLHIRRINGLGQVYSALLKLQGRILDLLRAVTRYADKVVLAVLERIVLVISPYLIHPILSLNDNLRQNTISLIDDLAIVDADIVIVVLGRIPQMTQALLQVPSNHISVPAILHDDVTILLSRLSCAACPEVFYVLS